MEVKTITENKEAYMDLLLLGDEQENLIRTYLFRGEVFALYDGDIKTICVVTKEDETSCEIKNLATYEKYQGKGYGSYMLKHILGQYKTRCKKVSVGTGENEKTLGFYKKHGFAYSHRVNDFFTDNYDHEILEDGKILKDMIYLTIEFDT